MLFNFNDEKMIVRLNDQKQQTMTFENAEFYNQFKEIHGDLAPKENPFLDFSNSFGFVPRATVVQEASAAKPFDPEKEALEQKTYMQFEMFKEKFNFFLSPLELCHRLNSFQFQLKCFPSLILH